MAKRLKASKLAIGMLVVASEEEYSQVYTVAKLEDKGVNIVWFEGKHKCNSWAYKDIFYKPTIEQIEFSIMDNGRLASFRDVMEKQECI